MSLDALQAGLGDDWPFETFPQYLDTLEKRGSAINIAALFGHTPLRLYVMGEELTERAATQDEIGAMKKLMREAMEAGAIGFGTSVSVSHNGYAGKPVPSRQATVEEMDALVSVMGEMKRGLMQITIGRDFSTRHMAEVSRKYGVPVTWTALLSYLYGPGGHRKQLDLAAEQRKSGAMVIPQVSCRPLNFEFTFAEPFIFDVMKFMNELVAGRRQGARHAPPRLCRSGVAREAAQRGDAAVPQLVGPRGHRLGAVAQGARGAAAHRGRGEARQGSGRSRARHRARQRPAGALPHGRDELRREGSGRADHRSEHDHRAQRTPAPMPASCATPATRPTCSATGCASARPSPSSRPCTTSRNGRPRCSASPIAACWPTAGPPTSWCSIPRPSAPARSSGSTTCRPAPTAWCRRPTASTP